MDIAARQLARADGQLRDRPPELSVEMQHAVQQIVPDRADRAVDMGVLPAFGAIRPGQRRAAVEARPGLLAGTGAAMARLDGTGEQPARYDFAGIGKG